jgi:thioredoxin-like negative regulator of GroEL
VKNLTLEEFNSLIHLYVPLKSAPFARKQSFVPILIEFWSPLCTVCIKAESFLNKLEQAYKGKIILAKINIDNSAQLNELYSINKLPTFILFKNSVELVRVTGFKNEIELEKAIRQYVK